MEIGANTTIDRGSIDDTVIGAGTKIDNLVQVAHNVRIGRLCLLMSQVGIAGSVRVEDGCILAGQVGIAGHLTIGRGRATRGAGGRVRRRFPPARPGRAIRRARIARRCAPRRRCSSCPSLIRALERLVERERDDKR